MPQRLRTTACVLTGALLALPLVSTFHASTSGVLVASGAMSLLLIASWRPIWGAVALALVVPVASWVNTLAGTPWSGQEMTEVPILAVLAGVWIRRAFRPPIVAGFVSRPAAWLIAIAGLSAFVLLGVEQLGMMWLPGFIGEVGRYLVRDYFVDAATFPELHKAMVLIEGVLVAACFEQLTREHLSAQRRLFQMLLVGSLCAAAQSAQRLIQISRHSQTPLAALVTFLHTQRISPLWADVNAAGSYFALMTVAAVLAWLLRRHRDAAPLGAAALSVRVAAVSLLTLALWITGSRAAFLATLWGLAGALAMRRAFSRRTVLTVAAVFVAGFALVTIWNVRQSAATSSYALGARLLMGRVALRMTADHPVFGVGIGEFQRASRPYVDLATGQFFPSAVSGENAHNNFLQILAELGVVGLAAFGWLLWSVLAAAFRRLKTGDAPAALEGATWGVAAFLISCVSGHPLLTAQVSWGFFAMLGVTAGLATPTPIAPSRTAHSTRYVYVAAALLAITLPFRLQLARARAPLDRATIGVTSVLGWIDDVPYRMLDRHSVWFVSATTRGIQLPLRLTDSSLTPCRIEIAVDGRPGNIVEPSREIWTRLAFSVDAPKHAGNIRVDLRIVGDGCRVMAGPLKEM